jgi:hypothetical protein
MARLFAEPTDSIGNWAPTVIAARPGWLFAGGYPNYLFCSSPIYAGRGMDVSACGW